MLEMFHQLSFDFSLGTPPRRLSRTRSGRFYFSEIMILDLMLDHLRRDHELICHGADLGSSHSRAPDSFRKSLGGS